MAVAGGGERLTAGEVLRGADVATYVAKRSGGARMHAFEDGDDLATVALPVPGPRASRQVRTEDGRARR